MRRYAVSVSIIQEEIKEEKKKRFTLAGDDDADDDNVDDYGYGCDDDVLLFSFWHCPVAAVLSVYRSRSFYRVMEMVTATTLQSAPFWWLLAGGIFYFITII